MWLLLCGNLAVRPVEAEIITFASRDPSAPIEVHADRSERVEEGAYEVWQLEGHCTVKQADILATGEQGVIWIRKTDGGRGGPTEVLLYLEGNSQQQVRVKRDSPPTQRQATTSNSDSFAGPSWLGRLRTTGSVRVQSPQRGVPTSAQPTKLRAIAERDAIRQVRFQQPTPAALPSNPSLLPPGDVTIAPPTTVTPLGSISAKRVRVLGRDGGTTNLEVVPDPISGQLVGTATGGIRVIVEGVEAPEVQQLGTSLGKIVLETDNVVLWGPNIEQLQNGEATDFEDLPLEIYMEGNVVFREGDRVVYAERMYYDVRQRSGTVLDAEILTPVEQYEGLLRVRAEVLQQVDANTFQAFGGAVTSSRIGFPRYWLQADNVKLQDIQVPLTDYFTGEPERDPRTGEQAVAHELRTTSRSNFLYLAGLPVLYWPVFSTDLREPTFYVDNLSFGSDNVFGTQIRVDWNAYQLFGIREPIYGTDWQISTDYLSDRGPAAGTQFTYARRDLFGVPGAYNGILDIWGIYDTGLDNLGKDRRAVPFPDPLRGRVFLNHQHHFENGWSLRGELGLISDRNFLEQYFEQAWDTRKDEDTRFELKKIFGNGSLGISADFQPLDFYTRTEWLPRLDHYRLGRSLGERLTWFAHSHAGYANLITDPLPPPGTQPAQSPLEWETDTSGTRFDSRSGVRAATRQEIDLPFALGPAKFTPYLLGEAAYWGEDRDGNEATRLYGQVGVRSSLPMWTANPAVRSQLFNVNGLAHKVSFDTELFYADADQDLDRFPLYDPLNDDSVEQYERMFIANRFGGTRPAKFDPRQFALRSGMQSWVTGPTEIADDLAVFNASVRQRLQTKRGLPGRERVVDWITLDIGATLFPDADRDNFGSEVGLINYDFRWFIGDRFTLLSDGYADMFGDGLQEYTVGALISRPEFGNAYLGFRNIDGPFSSSVLTGSVSYRMSEKWIVTASGSFDFGPTGNIGQTVSVTKIGESFLVRAGVNVDVGRGNVGAVFSIEPRFLPRSRLGMVGGVQIPPAGARGVE